MKTFAEFIFEATVSDNPINWAHPNADSEHNEILHQHKSHEDEKKMVAVKYFQIGLLRDSVNLEIKKNGIVQ